MSEQRKLTKREALTICRDLWRWVLKTKAIERNKRMWPGWKRLGRFFNNCPCCEYSAQQGAGFCGGACLLSKVWPEGCMTGDSPYRVAYDRESTAVCARAIIKECNRLLRSNR